MEGERHAYSAVEKRLVAGQVLAEKKHERREHEYPSEHFQEKMPESAHGRLGLGSQQLRKLHEDQEEEVSEDERPEQEPEKNEQYQQ